MKSSKILIVDDDIALIDLVVCTLSSYNYNLLTALNGEDAFNIAIDEIPDIIITDWDMPVMNGIDLLKKLKNEPITQNIPVIMITGIMNTTDYLKEAFDAGAIDFIKKPIEQTELISRTRSMLMFSDFYNQALKQKDWELTLLSKNILKTNELNRKIVNKLDIVQKNIKEINGNVYNVIEEIKNEISHFIKTQAWEQFETYFRKVNPTYIDKLIKQYPTLTSNEIKLCVFLRLNLNSKEIASITMQNSESVDIARYRLRKKLRLARKDNLNAFLLSF